MPDGSKIDLIVPRNEKIPSFYQAADQMGFHALWFTETLFSLRRPRQGWTFLGRGDGMSALLAAAAATYRVYGWGRRCLGIRTRYCLLPRKQPS
jgi:alkanesulfonate monooxygenase SsuD/methylene tetrahydromethanopterin reductase-like flavin-dependent oxidoreductase (luciferase family)